MGEYQIQHVQNQHLLWGLALNKNKSDKKIKSKGLIHKGCIYSRSENKNIWGNELSEKKIDSTLMKEILIKSMSKKNEKNEK